MQTKDLLDMPPATARWPCANRKLSNAEFTALRSLSKEPWCIPRHGVTFYWKFNRTWRRAHLWEIDDGMDAAYNLLYLGLAEERYCCENQCRQYLHLSARGQALLARVNQRRLVPQPSHENETQRLRTGRLRGALQRLREHILPGCKPSKGAR